MIFPSVFTACSISNRRVFSGHLDPEQPTARLNSRLKLSLQYTNVSSLKYTNVSPSMTRLGDRTSDYQDYRLGDRTSDHRDEYDTSR
ncbi:hypothetical protein GJ496_011159 [Pomphorhynchus laevis]|nr:hypothetical protein GJ496_011159 [Pomphorhynchus laevis]